MNQRYYHGTDAAEKIIAEGFRLDGPRRKDAGDFGLGIYLTPQYRIAKCHGKVLKVYVDVSRFAYIENPYFLDNGVNLEPSTYEEQFFHFIAFRDQEMLTVRDNDRDIIAKLVREYFLADGYTGIRTGHRGETVVFDLSTITKVILD
jgi:hypothetical protein